MRDVCGCGVMKVGGGDMERLTLFGRGEMKIGGWVGRRYLPSYAKTVC